MGDYEPMSKSQQADAELQEFLMIEKQKAQVQAQVYTKLSITSKRSMKIYIYIFVCRSMSSMKYVGTLVSTSQEVNWTVERKHV